ncbi:extensin family protein [Sphingomonas sp. BK235]|uniref:extensin-like domain-containing protein n=1 Tax=Sphingomonas sp. BK235 TaxID=2512131 RepID=UPI0010E8CE88|nr:extensin family protein [Sphingomonas sp. BK235]TCP33767.1 extensin-like protein [Sphingomonas sp. BK235]
MLLALLAAAALLAWRYARGRPQDLPWTPLDLGEPVGLFTGRKLAALGDSPARCAALLDRAGVRYVAVPPRRPAEARCGYDAAVRLEAGGARRIALAPDRVALACPVAAALALWEWDVVAPAAQRHFGARVVRIEHLGSYSCRRMYGRSSGGWSEHATANALDVAGFRLADGTRVSVLRDWDGAAAKAAFLREVRDGACRVFATVLSPDYNAAHRDHLHLDQAARGATGWRACR